MTTTRYAPPTLTLTTPTGRTIAADVHGPADGPLVVLCASAPGSRLFDPHPQATSDSGVRLVTIDRPGYGRSDPLASGQTPTISAAADDVALVLDHLGTDAQAPASLAGWSAGGRVALATAARRPDLVSGVALLGTPAPHEEVAWIGTDELAMIEQLGGDAATATAVMTEALADLADDPGAAVEQICGGPADEGTLARPGVRDALVVMLAEAFVQGAAGLAADIASYTVAPWGFDPRAVGAPVHCWYGAQDTVVTPEHARWYAAQVAHGEVSVVADAGHLVVCDVWDQVLAWFTSRY